MTKYVLGIDQSTQGTKALLFDEVGSLICRTDLPHRQIIDDKGWVEHDPMEIYSNTVQVVKNLIEKAEIEGRLVLIDEFTTAGGEEDNNTIAIIADENIIQFYDTTNTTETQRNGDQLYTNTFFHKWGIVSSCGFVNALKIQK